MAVLVNNDTKVIVQGFTGRQGTFHAEQALEYGRKLSVALPRGAVARLTWTGPVFNTVKEAVMETAADASMIMVPGGVCGAGNY